MEWNLKFHMQTAVGHIYKLVALALKRNILIIIVNVKLIKSFVSSNKYIIFQSLDGDFLVWCLPQNKTTNLQ